MPLSCWMLPCLHRGFGQNSQSFCYYHNDCHWLKLLKLCQNCPIYHFLEHWFVFYSRLHRRHNYILWHIDYSRYSNINWIFNNQVRQRCHIIHIQLCSHRYILPLHSYFRSHCYYDKLSIKLCLHFLLLRSKVQKYGNLNSQFPTWNQRLLAIWVRRARDVHDERASTWHRTAIKRKHVINLPLLILFYIADLIFIIVYCLKEIFYQII